MSAADKARRLLRRPTAWIEAEGEGYALRLTAARTRPAQVLDEATFRDLCQAPGLARRAQGGWRARAGGAFEHETATAAGRPGFVEGRATGPGPDGRLETRRVNAARSAVRWLALRRDASGAPYLDAVHVAAAERLEHDAETAFRGPSVTLRWDALPRRGAGGAASRSQPGDRQMAAARRIEAALAACGADRGLVEAICIHATALQAAERALGLKRRGGRVALKRGLEALARHYRLAA